MKKSNYLIGSMFIILGALILFGEHLPMRTLGIILWSGFVLLMGINSFKKSPFNISACAMLAISLGLLLDQVPYLNESFHGSLIKPLFLLAIGLSFLFSKKNKTIHQ